MSRQAQLPPRCPLQKKVTNQQPNSAFSPPSSREYIDSRPRQSGFHKKSISQSFILDDQPAWLNDLLNDSDTDSHGTLHRRAASDSLTPFKDPFLVQETDQLTETESVDSCGTNSGFESSCTYGPNSPRKKENSGFPEEQIVSEFSEYSVQHMNHILDGCNTLSAVQLVTNRGSVGELNDDQDKLLKRHPGQRSRARKLQYIAELERTVDIIQNLGFELSVRVASLLQQHTTLSMENSTLKQQLLRVQHEKCVADGEYRLLQNEVERLRSSLPISSNNKMMHNWPRSSGYLDHSDALWDMLDLRKLDLN